MRINGNFVLANFEEEFILVPVEETALGFNEVVTLNEVQAFIWECLYKDATREEVILSVMSEYEVDRDVIEKDLDDFLGYLNNCGVIVSNQEEKDDSGKI